MRAAEKMRKPTDEEFAEVDWFSVFTEPARMRILRALVARSMHLLELAEKCGVPRPNISVHVNKLERAGLIASTREGQFRRCALTEAVKVKKGVLECAHPSGDKAVIPLG